MADFASPAQLQRQAVVANDLGLHVRPAAKIAALAKAALGRVWIEVHGERVDAKDPLEIVSLMAPRGTEMTIGIETRQDADILVRIARLIEDGFRDPL